jgi:hypothetical protein
MAINYKLGQPKFVDNSQLVEQADGSFTQQIAINVEIQGDIHGFIPSDWNKRLTTVTVPNDLDDLRAIKQLKVAAAQALLALNFPDVP